MLQDLSVMLFITCCALAPWVLPEPSRWLGLLAGTTVRWARHGRPQPAVRYVQVCRTPSLH